MQLHILSFYHTTTICKVTIDWIKALNTTNTINFNDNSVSCACNYTFSNFNTRLATTIIEYMTSDQDDTFGNFNTRQTSTIIKYIVSNKRYAL